MNGTPLSPRVFRGALVSAEPLRPASSVIVFQYNPDTLNRTLQARTSGGEVGSGPLRLTGPPEETIKLSVEVDAADQLSVGDPTTVRFGIRPALAALELLLYPPAQTMIDNQGLAASGLIEVLAPAAPLTVLVWGPGRVLPVRVTEFSVTEEAFDAGLNPIRAKVDLGMRVVTYFESGTQSAAGALSLANHVALEVSGALATSGAEAAAVRSTAGLKG